MARRSYSRDARGRFASTGGFNSKSDSKVFGLLSNMGFNSTVTTVGGATFRKMTTSEIGSKYKSGGLWAQGSWTKLPSEGVMNVIRSKGVSSFVTKGRIVKK